MFLDNQFPNFERVAGSEGRRTGGGGDSSIRFINFERVGDKGSKNWRQKIGEWKGGKKQYFDSFVMYGTVSHEHLLNIKKADLKPV